MNKIILNSLLISTTLLAGNYSFQLYSSKNKKYAQMFLQHTKYKDSFLYKTDSGYWTVRYKIFPSVSAGYKYLTKHHLKNFSIVPTDINKLKHHKNIEKKQVTTTKNITKNLTPCNTDTKTCITKKYPWEINQTKLSKEINISIPKFAIIKYDTNTTKPIQQQKKCYNKLLRFYTSFEVGTIKGLSPKNYDTYKNTYSDLKLGMQYSCFFNNFKFYTDDRAVLYAKKTQNSHAYGINFDIKELYLQSFDLFDNQMNFIIGRKQIQDNRSWWYDDNLDIIKLFNTKDLWTYKVIFGTKLHKDTLYNYSISSKNGADNTLLTDSISNKNNLKDTKFIILNTDYQYYINQHLSGYFIKENTSNDLKRDINWLGFRNYSMLKQIKYWIDFGIANGDDASSHISSYGYDLGFLYYPTTKTYYYGLSYANGKKSYSQPIFADNKSNFLTKNIKLHYYGEFLNPRLNNISILSLYWLYDYTPKKTFALMLHNYRQNETSPIIETNYYNIPTNRVNKDIGKEIDLFYKFTQPLEYNYLFMLAYFYGGKAFDDVTTNKEGLYAKFNFIYYW